MAKRALDMECFAKRNIMIFGTCSQRCTRRYDGSCRGRGEGTEEDNLELDEERKFGLTKIAKAARFSVSYLNGNVSCLFFQLYVQLVDASKNSIVVRRFLEGVER